MRIAAIDIGTNSVHMIVVNVRPDLSFEVIDREKDMVRLGAGGLDGRNLTPTAMTAAMIANPISTPTTAPIYRPVPPGLPAQPGGSVAWPHVRP